MPAQSRNQEIAARIALAAKQKGEKASGSAGSMQKMSINQLKDFTHMKEEISSTDVEPTESMIAEPGHPGDPVKQAERRVLRTQSVPNFELPTEEYNTVPGELLENSGPFDSPRLNSYYKQVLKQAELVCPEGEEPSDWAYTETVKWDERNKQLVKTPGLIKNEEYNLEEESNLDNFIQNAFDELKAKYPDWSDADIWEIITKAIV